MDTNSYSCEFCSHRFKTKSSLNLHKKTAQYCLKLRGLEKTKPECNFNCDNCTFTTTLRSSYDRHLRQCNKTFGLVNSKLAELQAVNERMMHHLDQQNQTLLEKENQIRVMKEEYENKFLEKEKKLNELKTEYEHKIDKLNATIKEMAVRAIDKPTTMVNTTTHNTNSNNLIQKMEPITLEFLKECSQNFTIEHILKGSQGYADYYLKYPLKERLICSDYSRRKVKYKDPHGNVITDPELQKLTPLLFESIKDVHDILIQEHMDQDTIKEWKKQHYDRYMDLLGKFLIQKQSILHASQGKGENKFVRDIIKKICSGAIIVENEDEDDETL